jgi:tyrosyl-tRNA synthetase
MEDRFGETNAELWNEEELDYRSSDIGETVTRIFAHAGEIARKHELCGQVGQLQVMQNKNWWGKSEDVWGDGFDLADLLENARAVNLSRILAKQRYTPSVQELTLNRMKELLEVGELNLGRLVLESMQTLDFKHLWDEEKIRFQIGSSNQWDLITEGIDCIKNLTGGHTRPPSQRPPDLLANLHGLAVPLLLGPTGEKYKQHTENAILIGEVDRNETPPLDLYQVLLSPQTHSHT